jgi:hypothetical protein
LRWVYYFCLMCFLSPSLCGAETVGTKEISIVLPQSSNNKVPVNFYIVQLIEEALATENFVANVTYSKEPMNEKRAIYSLQHGQIINLYWLSINSQLEQNLRAIKIPLYKGLHGKRILLIPRNLEDQFAKINNLEQLKAFVGLQQESWSDYQILVKNGLNIDGSHTYHAMHKALNNKLGDYFPRSVLTIKSEYQNNQTDNIMIEPTLILSYANNYYFFTNKQEEQLAANLETGLRTLMTNGRFEEIFDSYFAERLQGLNLPQRTNINLKK